MSTPTTTSDQYDDPRPPLHPPAFLGLTTSLQASLFEQFDGFVLFVTQHGSPGIFLGTPDSITALGLKKLVEDWCTRQQAIHLSRVCRRDIAITDVIEEVEEIEDDDDIPDNCEPPIYPGGPLGV